MCILTERFLKEATDSPILYPPFRSLVPHLVCLGDSCNCCQVNKNKAVCVVICGVFSARLLGSGIRASPSSPHHIAEQGRRWGCVGGAGHLGSPGTQERAHGEGCAKQRAPGSFPPPPAPLGTCAQGSSAPGPAANPLGATDGAGGSPLTTAPVSPR